MLRRFFAVLATAVVVGVAPGTACARNALAPLPDQAVGHQISWDAGTLLIA